MVTHIVAGWDDPPSITQYRRIGQLLYPTFFGPDVSTPKSFPSFLPASLPPSPPSLPSFVPLFLFAAFIFFFDDASPSPRDVGGFWSSRTQPCYGEDVMGM